MVGILSGKKYGHFLRIFSLPGNKVPAWCILPYVSCLITRRSTVHTVGLIVTLVSLIPHHVQNIECIDHVVIACGLMKG